MYFVQDFIKYFGVLLSIFPVLNPLSYGLSLFNLIFCPEVFRILIYLDFKDCLSLQGLCLQGLHLQQFELFNGLAQHKLGVIRVMDHHYSSLRNYLYIEPGQSQARLADAVFVRAFIILFESKSQEIQGFLDILRYFIFEQNVLLY